MKLFEVGPDVNHYQYFLPKREVEGLLDQNWEFRAVVAQYDLKGLVFIERWNDQDA
jgi:hypothetical protein